MNHASLDDLMQGVIWMGNFSGHNLVYDLCCSGFVTGMLENDQDMCMGQTSLLIFNDPCISLCFTKDVLIKQVLKEFIQLHLEDSIDADLESAIEAAGGLTGTSEYVDSLVEGAKVLRDIRAALLPEPDWPTITKGLEAAYALPAEVGKLFQEEYEVLRDEAEVVHIRNSLKEALAFSFTEGSPTSDMFTIKRVALIDRALGLLENKSVVRSKAFRIPTDVTALAEVAQHVRQLRWCLSQALSHRQDRVAWGMVAESLDSLRDMAITSSGARMDEALDLVAEELQKAEDEKLVHESTERLEAALAVGVHGYLLKHGEVIEKSLAIEDLTDSLNAAMAISFARPPALEQMVEIGCYVVTIREMLADAREEEARDVIATALAALPNLPHAQLAQRELWLAQHVVACKVLASAIAKSGVEGELGQLDASNAHVHELEEALAYMNESPLLTEADKATVHWANLLLKLRKAQMAENAVSPRARILFFNAFTTKCTLACTSQGSRGEEDSIQHRRGEYAFPSPVLTLAFPLSFGLAERRPRHRDQASGRWAQRANGYPRRSGAAGERADLP